MCVCVCVCVCVRVRVCVCDEVRITIGLCNRSRLLRDEAPKIIYLLLIIIIIDRFCIAFFAVEQIHCALVATDCEQHFIARF